MKEKYEKEATRALAEREREREGEKQSKDTAEERGTERNPEKEESADFLHEDDGGGFRKREITRISWR